jgi:methionine-rich copper-binding protein CopC
MNITRNAIIALASAFVLGAGITLAHATLRSSTPKDHEHVKTMPKVVTLTMKEAVETKVSVFKIYYLPPESMMKNGKMMTSAQMDDVAEAAARKYLRVKTDTAARVDAGYVPGTKAQTARVQLALKPTATKPGVYVVMWRATSVDTHTENGFIHFHYDGM